jgi:small-conductance mechanosensitive channel
LRHWPGLLADFADSLDWQDVTIATALGLGVLAVLWIARWVARRHYQRIAATPGHEVLEFPSLLLSRTTTVFVVVLALYVACSYLALPAVLDLALRRLVMIVVFVQAGLWATMAALHWLDHRTRQGVAAGNALAGSIGILRFAARAVIWAMVLLLVLENLGTDITALVAGLGIGGIAVALALQNVLGDLLASLSIALDQPFVVGDFLAVGEYLGSVEYVGIKSTRLRSLAGEQIVMPNSDLLSKPVRNFGRMVERRVAFTLEVEQETDRAALVQVAPAVRRIIEAQSDLRFDRCHLAGYGASGLQFEAVYYVRSPDYNLHMDRQQAIYFAIHDAFARLGVRRACPTQRVWCSGRARSTA